MGERRERWLQEKRDREFKKNRKEYAKRKKNRRKNTSWVDLMNERMRKGR